MLYANNTGFKLATLSFAVLMTLAVDGTLLWRFDAVSQANALSATLTRVTLPTVFVSGHPV